MAKGDSVEFKLWGKYHGEIVVPICYLGKKKHE